VLWGWLGIGLFARRRRLREHDRILRATKYPLLHGSVRICAQLTPAVVLLSSAQPSLPPPLLSLPKCGASSHISAAQLLRFFRPGSLISRKYKYLNVMAINAVLPARARSSGGAARAARGCVAPVRGAERVWGRVRLPGDRQPVRLQERADQPHLALHERR